MSERKRSHNMSFLKRNTYRVWVLTAYLNERLYSLSLARSFLSSSKQKQRSRNTSLRRCSVWGQFRCSSLHRCAIKIIKYFLDTTGGPQSPTSSTCKLFVVISPSTVNLLWNSWLSFQHTALKPTCSCSKRTTTSSRGGLCHNHFLSFL